MARGVRRQRVVLRVDSAVENLDRCLATISSDPRRRHATHMMMSNCFLRPLASTATSSPRSTRIITLSQCPTVMFVFSCLLVNLICVAQSGICKFFSRCHGPSGSSRVAYTESSLSGSKASGEGLLTAAWAASWATGESFAAFGSSDMMGRRGKVRSNFSGCLTKSRVNFLGVSCRATFFSCAK